MYPHYSIDRVECHRRFNATRIRCPLPQSDHTPSYPASLNFNRYYHQPSRFMAEDLATQKRMLSYYVAGFPGWSSREVDAWWRWFNRRPIGGKK